MSYDLITAEWRRRSEARVAMFKAEEAFAPNPTGALFSGPTQLASMLGGDEESEVQYDRFSGNPFAAIRPIAQTVAGLPLRIGRLVPARRRGRRAHKDALPLFLKSAAEEIEVLEGHPLLDVFRDPNAVMVAWHFWYCVVASLDLTGKAYVWMTQEDRRPTLWPVPASQITPVGSDERVIDHWQLQAGTAAKPVDIALEQVAYFHLPDPGNPHPTATVAPTEAVSRPIQAEESLEECWRHGFSNSLWPGLAVVMGEVFDEDGESEGRPRAEDWQRRQLYHELKKHLGGVTRYGEPIILDALIKEVFALTHKPAEMAFMESSKGLRSLILQAYGTNPVIVGELEGANRATAAEARKHFADFTVNPLVNLISQVLTKWMGRAASRRGERLVVYLEPYRPDDPEQKRADWREAQKAGAVTRNEWRQHIVGLPLREGWDDVVLPANTQPAEAAEASADSRGVLRTSVKAVESRQIVEARWLKQHERTERELQDALERLFAEQRDSVAERLAEADVRGETASADMLFAPAEWQDRTVELCRPPVARALGRGAAAEFAKAALLRRKQVEGFEVPPDVEAKILLQLDGIFRRDYWQDMHETTKRRLVATLEEGLSRGESLYELTTRIGDAPTVAVTDDALHGVLGSASNTVRALNIARTETTDALNCGHLLGMERLAADGLIKGKEWLVVFDEHTRPEHVAAQQRGPIPVDGTWNIAGVLVPYPGHPSLPPGQRCNCRCTIMSVVI